MEAPSSSSVDNKAAGGAGTPATSLSASSAFSAMRNTVSGDVAHPCAEITSGAAPSDEVTPFTNALLLSGDSTSVAGSSTPKTAASFHNVTRFNSSATVAAVELPRVQSEHAATPATSFFPTSVRGTGALETAASATNPPSVLHLLGGVPIEGSGEEVHRAGELDTRVRGQIAAPASSPLMERGIGSAPFSRDIRDRSTHTLRSDVSDDTQLMKTTCYLSPLDSAGGREVQQSGDAIDALWTTEESRQPTEPALPTVDNVSCAAPGSAGAMASATQLAPTDESVTAYTVPARNNCTTAVATATDAATPRCSKFEVLATVPVPLVGRVPMRIHWCCAAHWRAVQRTERGAQWAADGAPADVYCVPAHLHATREQRSFSASCVETKSAGERHGRGVPGTVGNTSWLCDVSGEARPQHCEARTLSSAVDAPVSTLCNDSHLVAERETHGSYKTRSSLPHVHSHSCTDMLMCEFCGHTVETYHCEDCDRETTEGSTLATETGHEYQSARRRFQGGRSCASAGALSLSSCKLVACRSRRPSISTPKVQLSSSESAGTMLDLDMSGAISSADEPSLSDSSLEEALMAAVALLQ
ncbi:hypothetical protein, unknown function [Leishmania tarentolae]|uniref:Uncharacterized protein n=1 Tax=Leishmania tarentolae TaxID=5689 RepID=A0A640KCL9_LEITA|nr:hypothetical protein, unknown function [Leishmania tarentolae]